MKVVGTIFLKDNKLLLVKPTSNNCNSVIYNGESQVLTRDADEGFVYSNNTGINAGREEKKRKRKNRRGCN